MRLRNPYKEFPSYEAARSASRGYEDARIVDIVAEKTQRMIEGPGGPVDIHAAQHLSALMMAAREGPVDVLELGGGCGAMFFHLDRIIPGIISTWSVVETHAMAAKGEAMFADGRLTFSDSVESVTASTSVAIMQGVLQCTADPCGYLAAGAARRPTYISVARTYTTDGGVTRYLTHSARIRDHGPGSYVEAEGTTSVALTLVPYRDLVASLAPTHRILMEAAPVALGRMGSATASERAFIAVARGPGR